jgi:hypothetical protein
MSAAQLAVVPRRWCRHHTGYAPADRGGEVMKGKIKMWICERCQQTVAAVEAKKRKKAA